MRPFFITGIGTDVGKTLVAAILAEACQADYWKPVQAGYAEGTDSEWVKGVLAHGRDPLDAERRVHPEVYKLAMAASPHIAAREEGRVISVEKIVESYLQLGSGSLPGGEARNRPLIIEGAGGLLVPLNEKEFVLDLAKKMDAPLILVSRNYLGSINHSLLTAAVCKAHGLRVAGWIFNDQYLHYEQEIVQWTGIPVIASIPRTERPDAAWIRAQAERVRPLVQALVRSTY